jgi:amino-acid N-acetyltransferase
VDDVFPANYVLVRKGEELIGVAGFESYAPHALLRSLAVAPQHRSKGLGRKLVADRLHAARATGIRAVYLLTTTAPAFFCRLGFESTSRENAPLQVENSREFASICPASAVFMLRSFD